MQYLHLDGNSHSIDTSNMLQGVWLLLGTVILSYYGLDEKHAHGWAQQLVDQASSRESLTCSQWGLHKVQL